MSLKNNEPKAKFLLPWPPFSSHQTFLLFHNFFGNWYNIQFGHWVFALKNKTKQNSRFLIINQSQILILCSLKSVGFFFSSLVLLSFRLSFSFTWIVEISICSANIYWVSTMCQALFLLLGVKTESLSFLSLYILVQGDRE